ncbi:MAG TPA: hypothetical protein VES19_04685 [Candidatus Limnocylindrales bacterium]|nr:hypothetical protein [Candidatus Limnocylindrales bacterium]
MPEKRGITLAGAFAGVRRGLGAILLVVVLMSLAGLFLSLGR